MTDTRKKSITYRDAGVDIEAGNDLVDAIKPLARATRRKGTDGDLGGFGGLFDLKAAGFSDPILVAATDGVGTKLEIAIETGLLSTVGIDLVAMCVNDLVVQGAEPLFFLDYLAVGKLDVEAARNVVAGIAEGCRQSGAALIGGETAEMPGFYAPRQFDLGGFAVGAAERGTLLPRDDIGEGDVILGLASTGFHSNGFSLVRKLVEIAGMTYDQPCPFKACDGATTLGAALITPTRIYVPALLNAIENGGIKALAHITGGGLTENIPRVLPDGLRADINLDAWSLPEAFAWAEQVGGIEASEMLRTFNCGIGMVAIVEGTKADTLASIMREAGETVFRIGTISSRGGDGDAVAYSGKLTGT